MVIDAIDQVIAGKGNSSYYPSDLKRKGSTSTRTASANRRTGYNGVPEKSLSRSREALAMNDPERFSRKMNAAARIIDERKKELLHK
ncbi:MAG: hypothetical protein ACXQTE_02800 [Methanosarcinaceae archaeon]